MTEKFQELVEFMRKNGVLLFEANVEYDGITGPVKISMHPDAVETVFATVDEKPAPKAEEKPGDDGLTPSEREEWYGSS